MPPSLLAPGNLSRSGPGGTIIPGVVFSAVSLGALRPLLIPHRPPCISLSLPTERRAPDHRVDRLRFHHLLEAVQRALAAAHPGDDATPWLAPLEALACHRPFWEHVHDGLVVLAADGAATVFVLEEPVPARAQVGDRFFVADLLRIAATAPHCRVLALSTREARLFAIGPAGLLPTPFPGSAAADGGVLHRDAVIDVEAAEPHRVRRSLGSGGTLHGGAGAREEGTRADSERFFRAVAEAVEDPDGPPLVVAALPEAAAMFRAVIGDRRAIADSLPLDPARMPTERLAALVRPLVERKRAAEAAALVDRFRTFRAHGRGSTDVATIARAAVAGRVDTLLVESGRCIPGVLDRDTGAVAFTAAHAVDHSLTGDLPAAGDDDLVGAIATAVVLHGGSIVAIDRLGMPDDTGLAALDRHADD